MQRLELRIDQLKTLTLTIMFKETSSMVQSSHLDNPYWEHSFGLNILHDSQMSKGNTNLALFEPDPSTFRNAARLGHVANLNQGFECRVLHNTPIAHIVVFTRPSF